MSQDELDDLREAIGRQINPKDVWSSKDFEAKGKISANERVALAIQYATSMHNTSKDKNGRFCNTSAQLFYEKFQILSRSIKGKGLDIYRDGVVARQRAQDSQKKILEESQQ